MVEYEYADYSPRDRTDRQMTIISDDELIKVTNEELHQQQFELSESLCSESSLMFGSCEASTIKFTVSNTFISMKGKWLTVNLNPATEATEPLQIGRYKVDSDTLTADRTKRDVVAYDAMYDIINADVSEWYDAILPTDDSTVTMREFRASFMAHFGIEEAEAELVNDGMTVEKTVRIVADEETDDTSTIGEALSGKDVICAICEINGCFGHIGRDGKFHYIYLPQRIQGLYPAEDLYPADDLYPAMSRGTAVGSDGTYISCHYEDYNCKSITKLQIRQEEGDIGVIVGSDGNSYVIEDNFLVYGKGSDELSGIAENILSKIAGIVYRPFDCEAVGNPCLEVGDAVRIVTKYEIVESYILTRTLAGIQALRDSYAAEGMEEYAEEVNSVHYSIKQIKSKANILTRTLEETRLEMIDLESGLSSKISATAAEIKAEVEKTYSTKTETSEGISEALSTAQTYAEKQAAASLQSAIADTDSKLLSYSTTTEMNSAIEQSASQIKLSVSETYTTKAEFTTGISDAISTAAADTDERLKSYSTTTEMNSAIEQSASQIKLSVSETYETKENAESNYESLSASIQVNADAITSKVTKGEISSLISQESGSITISADRISISSTNFTLTNAGVVTMTGATIKNGTITQTTSTATLSINNAEITGSYIGEGEGWIDFSNRTSGVATLQIGHDNSITILASNLYVGESHPDTVYAARSETYKLLTGITFSSWYVKAYDSSGNETGRIYTVPTNFAYDYGTFMNGILLNK